MLEPFADQIPWSCLWSTRLKRSRSGMTSLPGNDGKKSISGGQSRKKFYHGNFLLLWQNIVEKKNDIISD